MDFSTNFQLPYLMPAQAQKHVTVNEALRLLDALCQANAVSMSTAAQPASPADGALYIIPAGKSGADWDDAANWSLGLYADGAWAFVSPREGWLVWVKDAAALMRWTGAAWVQVDIVTLATVLGALANGGSLADPNADRILFWDDSENGFRHLAPSGNLSISGATLDVGSNIPKKDAANTFSASQTYGVDSFYSDSDYRIVADTADGADNKKVSICGGGTPSVTRGGFVAVEGNESANAGRVSIYAGNAGGGLELGSSGGPCTANGSSIVTDAQLTNAAAVKAINQGLSNSSAVRHGSLGLGTSPPSEGIDVQVSADTRGHRIRLDHAGFASEASRIQVVREANAAYQFARWYSGDAADLEFSFRGDGNAFCDGAWSGGGADYAEYFEWQDGNPEDEDRRGLSVAPAPGGLIRPATEMDDPEEIIGVVSANPTITGDAAALRWTGKYLRDDYGACLREDHDVAAWTAAPADPAGEPAVMSFALDALPEGVTVPAGATITTQERRVLNPEFDPEAVYQPRAERREWAAIGMMGKLRLRAGQPVNGRWIKLRDISEHVEEWLVR